jgi:hypothetical protein
MLTTVTLEVVQFRVYALFPALLSFFKYILEVVSYEGVQHRLPRSPKVCQNGGLSVLSAIGETEK